MDQLSVGDLLRFKKANGGKDLITLNTKSTVQQALELFNKHKLIAAPLKTSEGKYAILNLYDLLCAICLPLNNPADFAHLVTGASTEKLTPSAFIQRLTKELFETEVEDILGVSEESRHLSTFHTQDPLNVLGRAFSSGGHHALVLEKEKIVGFLSQTDLLRFVLANESMFGKVLNKSLQQSFDGHLVKQLMGAKPKSRLSEEKDTEEEELSGVPDATESLGSTTSESGKKSGNDRVVCVESTTTALQAFGAMYRLGRELRAIPVVDSVASGILIDCLSVSDLRGLTPFSVSSLMMPVGEFLNLFPGQRVLQTCEPSDTIGNAMASMVDSHVHRVWVVEPTNSGSKLTGVVTATDVVRVLL